MSGEAERRMLNYYDKLFPAQEIFKWLNHSSTPGVDFTHREFALVLQKGQYLRYQSYGTVDTFKRDLKRLTPERFEIGAVYTVEPRQSKSLPKAAYRPLAKELVFDIDMDDYADYRTCCNGKKVCVKCWQFVVVAMECLERALRQDFGYEHIVWVFSGRRGVHAWVCDPKARDLQDHQRSAIIQYLKLPGTLTAPYHPHLEASYEICVREFHSIILDQQNLYQLGEIKKREAEAYVAEHGGNKVTRDKETGKEIKSAELEEAEAIVKKPSAAEHMLGGFCDQVKQKMSALDFTKHSSAQIWKHLEETIKGLGDKTLQKAQQAILPQVVLDALYPKLDTHVTRATGHLLKSPFCVHPATQKVCVPIDMSQYKGFDPDQVPTLQTLEEQHATTGHASKTSLAPYVETFSRFTTLLLRSEKRPNASLEF